MPSADPHASARQASSEPGSWGHASAWAGTNIALVKYWGKRPGSMNLPAAGSLSLTLADLGTRTSVRFLSKAVSPDRPDEIWLNGAPADPAFARRTSLFLDRVRSLAGIDHAAHVVTENTIPTAAGLASSASGFAALATAASRAAGLALSPPELSRLARQGSGSAARSIFGGFVEMAAGTAESGEDAVAHQVLPPESWDLRLVVALTAKGAKAIGSTEAMTHTAATSPFFAAWIESVDHDLADARDALSKRDFGRLGRITERSCLRMHASAMASDPGILYWNPVTVAAIHELRALRSRGVGVYFTIDAGPHVKALCEAENAATVAQALASIPGVLETLIAHPGPGVSVIEQSMGATA